MLIQWQYHLTRLRGFRLPDYVPLKRVKMQTTVGLGFCPVWAEEEEAASGDDGESREHHPEPSLFPLFHLSAAGEPFDPKNPLCLRNASLTVDVASLPTTARAPAVPLPSEDGRERRRRGRLTSWLGRPRTRTKGQREEAEEEEGK